MENSSEGGRGTVNCVTTCGTGREGHQCQTENPAATTRTVIAAHG